jgi:hypothetical protein
MLGRLLPGSVEATASIGHIPPKLSHIPDRTSVKLNQEKELPVVDFAFARCLLRGSGYPSAMADDLDSEG